MGSMRQIAVVLLLIGAALYTYFQDNPASLDSPADEVSVVSGPAALPQAADGTPDSDRTLQQIYEDHGGAFQYRGSGEVIRVLRDDTKGSQHQRFIVRIESGETLLIAHNIDLAPRVAGIQVGDRVEFYGEYEWNPQGGVIHWTHHDPRGTHPGGWIEHEGKRYE